MDRELASQLVRESTGTFQKTAFPDLMPAFLSGDPDQIERTRDSQIGGNYEVANVADELDMLGNITVAHSGKSVVLVNANHRVLVIGWWFDIKKQEAEGVREAAEHMPGEFEVEYLPREELSENTSADWWSNRSPANAAQAAIDFAEDR